MNFKKILREATAGTSPIVKQIVKQIDVPAMVQQGIDSEYERTGRRVHEYRDDRARTADAADREATERQYERLERRLEQLLREAEAIRREMEQLRDD